MKISSISTLRINPYQKQLEKAEAVANTNQKRDNVEISFHAKELQQAGRQESARQEKIERLAAQIQAGTYEIDAEAIAEGLINSYKK